MVKQSQYNSEQINQMMIYDNFEILDRNIAKKLISKNINLEKLFIECYIINNYIIVNFPNKLNENKLLSTIGIYKHFFKTKYALIFEKSEIFQIFYEIPQQQPKH